MAQCYRQHQVWQALRLTVLRAQLRAAHGNLHAASGAWRLMLLRRSVRPAGWRPGPDTRRRSYKQTPTKTPLGRRVLPLMHLASPSPLPSPNIGSEIFAIPCRGGQHLMLRRVYDYPLLSATIKLEASTGTQASRRRGPCWHVWDHVLVASGANSLIGRPSPAM